jgi:hypothetical protein
VRQCAAAWHCQYDVDAAVGHFVCCLAAACHSVHRMHHATMAHQQHTLSCKHTRRQPLCAGNSLASSSSVTRQMATLASLVSCAKTCKAVFLSSTAKRSPLNTWAAHSTESCRKLLHSMTCDSTGTVSCSHTWTSSGDASSAGAVWSRRQLLLDVNPSKSSSAHTTAFHDANHCCTLQSERFHNTTSREVEKAHTILVCCNPALYHRSLRLQSHLGKLLQFPAVLLLCGRPTPASSPPLLGCECLHSCPALLPRLLAALLPPPRMLGLASRQSDARGGQGGG